MSFSLPIEILINITSFLPHNDQLKMRALCKNINHKIIKDKTFIYEKIELLCKELRNFLETKDCHILDLYLSDHTKGLLPNVFIMIDDCVEMKLLMDLLNIDRILKWQKKSFTLKDKKIMKQNNDNKYFAIGSGILDHFNKTNNCHRKFNEKLNLLFDNKQWFIAVRNILMGKEFLTITEEMKEQILDAIEFGNNIDNNYDEIKKDIYNCKRVYFDQQDRIK